MENNNLDQITLLSDVLRRVNEDMSDFWEQPAKSAMDKGSSDDYPLHKIAIWGDVDAAKVLLANGADINALGEDGDTPLHRAIAGEKVEMARFLILQGANVYLQNMYGNTALDDITDSGSPELMAMINEAR